METELLHGTLDALVLKTLTLGRAARLRHRQMDRRGDRRGRGRSKKARSTRRSTGMERRGLIEAEWGTSELGRKAKFYRITPKGRRQLAADTEQWARFATGVSKVLLPA